MSVNGEIPCDHFIAIWVGYCITYFIGSQNSFLKLVEQDKEFYIRIFKFIIYLKFDKIHIINNNVYFRISQNLSYVLIRGNVLKFAEWWISRQNKNTVIFFFGIFCDTYLKDFSVNLSILS